MTVKACFAHLVTYTPLSKSPKTHIQTLINRRLKELLILTSFPTPFITGALSSLKTARPSLPVCSHVLLRNLHCGVAFASDILVRKKIMFAHRAASGFEDGKIREATVAI